MQGCQTCALVCRRWLHQWKLSVPSTVTTRTHHAREHGADAAAEALERGRAAPAAAARETSVRLEARPQGFQLFGRRPPFNDAHGHAAQAQPVDNLRDVERMQLRVITLEGRRQHVMPSTGFTGCLIRIE